MALGSNDIQILIKARDECSGVLDKVQGKTSKLGGVLKKALVGGAIAGGAALAGLGVASLKMGMDFEKSMAEVKTLMPDISEKAFGKMKDDVLDLSKEMGIATDKAVPALYQAISAGIPRENVMEFMKVASKAAIGGVTDLETAVDGLTTVVNAFGLEASEAGRVADVMFTGVKLGKTTMEELSTSMFQAAPLAASLGLSIEDVVAATATLTKSGTPTAQAMTQIRQSMVALAKPNADMIALLEKTGYASGEALFQAKGFAGALDILTTAAGGNKEIMAKAFGSVEALQAVLGLTGENALGAAADLDAMTKAAGAAEEAFGTISETTAFKFNKAINEIKVEMTKLAMTVLPLLVDGLEWAKEGFGNVMEVMGKVKDALQPLLDKIGPLIAALKESKDVSTVASAIIGGVLVGAFIALAVAAGAAAVSVIAATWPFIAVGVAIAGVTAAIVLAIRHWDDITAAVQRARDWFLDLPAPIKALVIVLGYPLVPLIALGVGIHKLATNWDSAWYAIRATTEAVINTIITMIATLVGAIAKVLGGLASVAEAIPSWVPGASKVAGALRDIANAADSAYASLLDFRVSLVGAANAANAFQTLGSAAGDVTNKLGTGLAGAIVKVASGALRLKSTAQDLTGSLGPGPGGVGGGGGAAAGGLDAAATAALEARKAFVVLHGSTTLLSAMNYEATITEFKLSDAMRQAFGVGADLSALWQEQIGILQGLADELRGTGGANDILVTAIEGTIEGLEAQIIAAGDAKDALILMGEDAVGPVAAMFQGMVDNIDKATDALKGLLGIQTQEEAQLAADIAALDLEIAKIDQLAGELRGLSRLEETLLRNAESRLPKSQEELELLNLLIEGYARRREEGDKLKWNEKNEEKAAKERILILEEQITKDEERIEELKELAERETAAGRAARESVEDYEARKAALVDDREELDATKKALGTYFDAQVEGRPKMDELTGTVFAQARELGLWKGDVESLSPALRAWYLTHSRTVFDIMLNFNHLLLNQQDFTSGSITLAAQWETAWRNAAAGVAGALADVAGGEVAAGVGVPTLQGGGYITHPGLAYVHAGEAVVPAAGVSGGGVHHHYHVGEHGIYTMDHRQLEEIARQLMPLIRRDSG